MSKGGVNMEMLIIGIFAAIIAICDEEFRPYWTIGSVIALVASAIMAII